jgi:hypothetical protein
MEAAASIFAFDTGDRVLRYQTFDGEQLPLAERRHCEERSDEAIHTFRSEAMGCFARDDAARAKFGEG